LDFRRLSSARVGSKILIALCMNRQKIIGIVVAFFGVVFTRCEALFGQMDSRLLLACKAAGTALALGGLCVFAAGIRTTVKKVAVCRSCGGILGDADGLCASCRKKSRGMHGTDA